jgi:hypothetical protein
MSFEQLSFADQTRVVIQWYRDRQSWDATGPMDTAFEASISTDSELSGCGRTEKVAMELLADRLRAVADAQAVGGGNGDDAQALAAAACLSRDRLLEWLWEHTWPTLLAS